MAAGVVQGVVLGLALLSTRHGQRLANRLIAAYLFVIALDLCQGMLYVSGYIRWMPHFLRIGSPAAFLIGPLLLLAYKALTNPRFTWQRVMAAHFVPAVLCMTYLLPLYFSSSAEKVAYIEQAYQSLPLDSYLVGGFKRIHIGIYLVWTGWFMWTLTQPMIARKKPELLPLMWAVWGLWGVLWGIDVYEYIFDFQLLTGIGILQMCLLALALIGITYAALRYPTVWASDRARAPRPKYATSTLHPQQMDTYAERLQSLMEEEHVYRDGSLTLGKLADKVVLTPHELSHLLNAHFKQNFATFINQQRIAEAKAHLRNPAYQHLTIAAIAETVGFNSSSSFNAAFKKFAEMTPSQYRREARIKAL